jgi:hypothetical protein
MISSIVCLPLSTNEDMKARHAKLEKVVYARVTTDDLYAISALAEERQQSISQLIRKTLIDQGLIRN